MELLFNDMSLSRGHVFDGVRSLKISLQQSWLYGQPFKLPRFRWLNLDSHMFSRSWFGAPCSVDDSGFEFPLSLPLGAGTKKESNHLHWTDCAYKSLIRYCFFLSKICVYSELLKQRGISDHLIVVWQQELDELQGLATIAKSDFRLAMRNRRMNLGLRENYDHLSTRSVRMIIWLERIEYISQRYEGNRKVQAALRRYLGHALNLHFGTDVFTNWALAKLISYSIAHINERTTVEIVHHCRLRFRSIEVLELSLLSALTNTSHPSRVVDSLLTIERDEYLPNIVADLYGTLDESLVKTPD